jgi:hypothetical protein
MGISNEVLDMPAIQTYSKKASAIRAALADLGKYARDGVDYKIVKLPDGRFAYKSRLRRFESMNGSLAPAKTCRPRE